MTSDRISSAGSPSTLTSVGPVSARISMVPGNATSTSRIAPSDTGSEPRWVAAVTPTASASTPLAVAR